MTPKEILIKEGHIIQFRGGQFAYYLQNSLGKFLILGHWGFLILMIIMKIFYIRIENNPSVILKKYMQ